MTNSEKNIDKLIRTALGEEEIIAFDDLGEQNVFEQAFGVMKGRYRFLLALMGIMAFVFFAFSIYCAVRFFEAIETKDLILWASGVFMSILAMMSVKVYWWMEMEKNATIREIKRVELQIANLAAMLKK